MVVATTLKNYLSENDVAYEVLPHRDRYTSTEVAQALHVSGNMLAKVVITRVGSRQVMAVLPAEPHVDLEALARVLGVSRVDLADESEFAATFPDCEVGAMPPFGNLYGVEVVVDRRLAEQPALVFEAGNHHEAIRMQYADFARLVRPTVADICAV